MDILLFSANNVYITTKKLAKKVVSKQKGS